MKHSLNRAVRGLLFSAAAVALMGLAERCDSTAKFTPRPVRFDKVQTLGGTGAAGDDLVTSCRQNQADDLAGVAIHFNLLSTLPEGRADRDVSIRPGDRVEKQLIAMPGAPVGPDTAVLSTANPRCVETRFQCVEPYPDPDLGAAQPACSGPQTTPSADTGRVEYVSHVTGPDESPVDGRGRPIAVVMLVDQSGSMNGLTVARCEDRSTVTVDTCGADGRCWHTCPANPCDDGDPCTEDTCGPAGRCIHVCRPDQSVEACGHICGVGDANTTTGCETDFDCDETPNPDNCTEDTCVGGLCRHADVVGDPACLVTNCSTQYPECPERCTSEDDCDDGDPLTENACVAEKCVYKNLTPSYLGCYPETQDPPIGTAPDLASVASDPKGLRLAAARWFIDLLNEDDRLLVMSYNEKDGLRVVCDPGTGAVTGDLRELETACFGRNRDLALNALDTLQGKEYGRTPLWAAVEEAWRFLSDPDNEKAQTAAARHIVVVSDGPDTCSLGDYLDRETGICANSRTYHDVLCRMRPGAYPDCPQRDQTTGAPIVDSDVHVNFVQFQAVGYPSHDPHQVEMACMTGGQYQFINSRDFPQITRSQQLDAAMKQALSRVRYALAGYWVVRLRFDPLSDAGGQVQRGQILSLSGLLRLLAGRPSAERNEGCGLSNSNEDAWFDIGADARGTGSGQSDTPNWDQRVVFAKQCDPADPGVCPGYDENHKDCREYCSEDQRLCVSGGIPRAGNENQPCSFANGTAGQCVGGFCVAGVPAS